MDQSEEYINEILLDDPLLDSNGAVCNWRVGNQLVVAPRKSEPEESVSAAPILLHEVHWNKDMHHDITRKLLNESHQVFVQVQAAKTELCKGVASHSLLVKFSRKYRSVLRACVLELKSKIEENIEEDESVQQMELLRMMEIIWNLCEILFIENCPAGIILSRLADWCKWHFTQADDFMEECIQAEQPHMHELFWSAIKCLVLQGRTEDAQNMLKLHPHSQPQVGQDNAFASMEELLRKMPHFSSHGQSVIEFEMKWNHWQEECRRRLEEGVFEVNEHLREVAMILCGEEIVFDNPEYGAWHQMLVSRLLYTQPTVSITELQHHSKLSVETFGGRGRLGAFDHILLAAFEVDPYLLIKECSQHLSNWWLPAHLADLFHHAGLLSQKKLDFGVDFRELLLLEYSTSLMSHDSLWRVTIDYLCACPENGSNYVSLFVQKIPLSSEKKVAKLLRICQNRGLVVEAQSICRQMSISAYNSNHLGVALMWSLRSNDSSLIMHIAERMLAEYAHTGEFQYIDLLDYLGTSVMLSERLMFLGKYRDFHKLLSQGNVKDAGNLVLHLLVSRIAPKEFWPSLLTDTLSLVDCEQLVYNASDSAKLLGSLNSLDWTEMQKCQTSTQKETIQKRLELLRLALSRNLARAVIELE